MVMSCMVFIRDVVVAFRGLLVGLMWSVDVLVLYYFRYVPL